MLTISDLFVSIEDKHILQGLNLKVKAGEVHAIMGPNGAGKSTFAKVIAGYPDYKVATGTLDYCGLDLKDIEMFERSLQGIFIGFQYPVEVPGVTNENFLKMCVNAHRKSRAEMDLDSFEFREMIEPMLKELRISPEFLSRGLNVGFSGGEKKKNEILQMNLLKPKLAILDETDSGLDIDALQVVAQGINNYRASDNAIVLITHYNRLLELVKPDFIHVLQGGKIVESGDYTLAHRLEERGYGQIH